MKIQNTTLEDSGVESPSFVRQCLELNVRASIGIMDIFPLVTT